MRTFWDIDSRLRIEKLDDVVDAPKVIRVNKFDEDALEEFEKDMDEAHQTHQPVIPIVVDSFGGSAYGCLGMLAAIEAARVPVATILTSKAMSAGAILFCWGTDGYRYMHPDAWMMIHDVGTFSCGKIEEIKADTKMTDEMNQRMYKRLSKKLGHKEDYIGSLIKEHHHLDWFLTAKDAKKHNIANHLKVPCFEAKIELTFNFG